MTPQPPRDGNADAAARWVDAFNRRDAEAIVALAAPRVVFWPTVLAGGKRSYHGHQGLRDWIADQKAIPGADHVVHITEVRDCATGDVVVLGNVMLDDRPMSAFTMRLTFAAGLVVEGHAYLSDEGLLAKLGLTDG